MADPKKTDTPPGLPTDAPEISPADERAARRAGKAEVQEAMDDETEQGFRGVKVDPTPNEHYTVEGVARGLPTPETDPEQAAKAAARGGRW